MSWTDRLMLLAIWITQLVILAKVWSGPEDDVE